MADLLIKLYDLPDAGPFLAGIKKQGMVIRRAGTYEKFQVVEWVGDTFDQGWAGECDAAFSRQPVSCFLAISEGAVTGFACYDCTFRGFFGPIGVSQKFRGRGVGSALLVRSLHAMAEIGYAYAIVGDGGAAADFYSRTVEVQPITGSTPGIYADKLHVRTTKKSL